MFKVQFPLGHRLWSNNISLHVSLDGICDTKFHVICVQALGFIARCVVVLDVSGRHSGPDSNPKLVRGTNPRALDLEWQRDY
jgi:hypothetical protein